MQKQPKNAFITGAASGLGKALCLELAKEGWQLGICDKNEKLLIATKAQLEENGAKVWSYTLDVTDAEAYRQTVDAYLKAASTIDLLINNAGIGAAGLVGDISIVEWQKVIGVNQMAVIYGCSYFVPVMKKQGYGQIINIASAAAFSSAAGMAAYNSGKAAILSFSETLYAELKGDNIAVSVVMPTFFKTDIMREVSPTADGRKLGELLIATSNLEADVVARKILKAAFKGKFYIILPWRSKMLYHLKRFFPSLMLRLNTYLFKKRDRMEAMLEKKLKKELKKR